ncbi:MAG: EAL domain-containing protein [Actinomycetota bacterium]
MRDRPAETAAETAIQRALRTLGLEIDAAATWYTSEAPTAAHRQLWIDPSASDLGPALRQPGLMDELQRHLTSGVEPGAVTESGPAGLPAAVRDALGQHLAGIVTVVTEVGDRIASLSALRSSSPVAPGGIDHEVMRRSLDSIDGYGEASASTDDHRGLGELVERCSNHLIHATEAGASIVAVLNEITAHGGYAGAAWITFDARREVLTINHAVGRDGAERTPPPMACPSAEWQAMWAGGVEARHCGFDEEPLRSLRNLAPHLQWSPRIVIPVVDGGEPIGILDVHGAPGADDDELLTFRTIAHLLHSAASRLRAQLTMEAVFDDGPTSQLLLDDQGVVALANLAAIEVLGDVRGRRWLDIDPDYQPEGPVREVRLPTPDGLVWARVGSSQMPAVDRGGFAVVHIEDITERRTAIAQLEFEALHDQLTALKNRRWLSRYLDDVLETEGLSVLLLDIDRIKVVNDSLGHDMGDRLIVTMADRLRFATRSADSVIRFGGDEFVLVLPGEHSRADLIGVADRVRRLVSQPIELDGIPVIATASIGIASIEQGDAADTAIRHADWALAEAKRAGRDQHRIFDPADAERVKDRLRLEARLRRSLDAGEFIAHYQPEYDMRTGEILGAETLVRWVQNGEIVPAYQFIDAAEELGLASRLSSIMLETACAQATTWREIGLTPRLRVNITAQQLQSEAFEFEVIAALARHRMPAEQLCLEVTERSIMADIDAATKALARLRAVGCEVAIDDFGTGFSSLAWLRRLPVDTLKIDRSFVDPMVSNDADRHIVQTIVGLARGLDLDVVAEGVESETHVEALLALGCRRGQGWLWSPAVPPEEFTELVLAASPDRAS